MNSNLTVTKPIAYQDTKRVVAILWSLMSQKCRHADSKSIPNRLHGGTFRN